MLTIFYKKVTGQHSQITDNSGNLAAEYSYDAWGRMRNPANWQVYAQGSQPAMLHGERGYTGHEQLNGFGLINMNARLYDPLLARFLAPDPFVGSGLTNDFNRYIYARNNPMMYTDPTGKSFSSWWKKNIAIPFMQELHHVFGNGFTLSFGTDTQFLSTSAVIAPNGSNGMPYGPGFGVQTNDWKTFSPVYANCQGGFMNTQSVNYESNLQKTVVQAENSARKEYYSSQTRISNWASDAYSWAKNHFYVGMEGEITRGDQIAVTLKNGLGVNLDPYSTVVVEGSLSNKEKPLDVESNDKIKLYDFGVAYGFGVNYNQTIDYSGLSEQRTNNISIGAVGVFGVKLNYDNNWNFIDGFVGIDISGKIAVGYGASGSLKLGFNF